MTVPFSAFKKLQEKGKDKDATISDLEHQLLLHREHVEELSGSVPGTSMGLKENLKTYSGNTRMRVFDHIVNKVPTASAAMDETDVPQWNYRSLRCSLPTRTLLQHLMRQPM